MGASSVRVSAEVRVAGALLALFVVSNVADAWVFHHVAYPRIYDHDWGRMLRLVGYLPVWLIVAAVLVAQDRARLDRAVPSRSFQRGVLLLSAPVAAGLLCEIAKMLVRRIRPNLTDGVHVFRPWSDRPFETRDLGFPSSHTVVAFGAATMLARLLPWGAPLWYGLALACAATRVLSQAHFLSDAIAGALVGYVVALLLWRRFGSGARHL